MPAELVQAIRNGDANALGKLLEGGAGVNTRDAEGNTPLILAALYSGPDCVELLLKRGADVNAANKGGATALIRAATDYEKARLLIAAGARVGVRTGKAGNEVLGNTPLLLAARRSGNARTVRLFIEHQADVRERNDAGASPIIAAAASGDLEIVKLLLEHGADANDTPKPKDPQDSGASAGRRTPLMWAAFEDNLPVLQLLRQHGADPNKASNHGTPLSHATWHDSFAAAEFLLDQGAKVDEKDRYPGYTPLLWAAGTDSPRPRLVQLLLDRGANPNAEGGQMVTTLLGVPQTPRLLAEKRGRTAIVEALVAAGAKAPPPSKQVIRHKRPLPEKLESPLLTTAAENAIAMLQVTAKRSRESFLRNENRQDCTSCHQQTLPMAAVGHARMHSVRLDQEAAREQIGLIGTITDIEFKPEFILQSLFHPDPTHTFGYELFGLMSEHQPASYLTDVRVQHLVTIQAGDGRWFMNLPRPPMMSSDVTATALAIQAIKQYGWRGRKIEFDRSVDRGRKWLESVKTETNEESVYQLLGLHWAGVSADKLAPLARALSDRQRPDGGWSQLPTLESDAYATGQVLFALAQVGYLPVTGDSWQRGLRFLLETQEADGTWHVVRRAFPIQPTMVSRFPHHRDSWISASGTSWAVLAITQALPAGVAMGNPPPPSQLANEVPVHSTVKVNFAQQIKPVLERSCLGCHGPEKPRNGYRMDSRAAILKGGDSGFEAITPGNSAQSPLLEYVSERVPDLEMPPPTARKKFPGLSKEEQQLLRAWVEQGAEWPDGVVLTPREENKKP